MRSIDALLSEWLTARTQVFTDQSDRSAALPLVAGPLFHNLGVDWACTLLGCVAILLGGIPIIFLKFGAKLRGMSKLVSYKVSTLTLNRIEFLFK